MIYIFIPIVSMHGIVSHIYHKNQPNVGIYTIHGSHGILTCNVCMASSYTTIHSNKLVATARGVVDLVGPWQLLRPPGPVGGMVSPRYPVIPTDVVSTIFVCSCCSLLRG